MNKYDYEEDLDPNRWLISYADFITLLFAFFVVMYAISSVNDGKYRILSASLHKAFDIEARSLQILNVGDPSVAASPHVVDIPDTMGFSDADPGNTFIQDPQISDDLVQQMAGFIDEQLGEVSHDNDWIEINLHASQLFASGRATLSTEAQSKLRATADFLSGFDDPITIEGYTDNVVAEAGGFPSNWELSASRASAVAHYLEQQGISAHRLAAIGYGENYPIETNATPEGRQSNRRVVLMVARKGNNTTVPNSVERQRTFAHVRNGPVTDVEKVSPVRTETGGLLFTRDSVTAGRVGTGNN